MGEWDCDTDMRIIGWYSCGNNSAVNAKLLLEEFKNHDVRIIRCLVDNEHPDNDRVHSDVEKWLNHPIERLRSADYKNCWDVWEKRRYISGIHGAPCTIELKKAVRWMVETEWHPDIQSFGFSSDEENRKDNFIMNNPDIRIASPLIREGITKADCVAIMEGAGIEPAAMYKLGFSNNNCIGCAKATSIVYWARTRHYFPNEFYRMAELSRRLGARLTRFKGERIFIDDIPIDFDWQKKDRSKAIECGIGCATR